MISYANRFIGTLLGMAVGDAIGLPREGLSKRRANRMFGDAPLSHRLIFHRGMISDDTEHACMTAQALLSSRGHAETFVRSLAWRLRGWLVGLQAGVGLATLRSTMKLWLDFGPRHSGVKSAGNGPAMRAPILGVWIAATAMSSGCGGALLGMSTHITHTDECALEGASAIARDTAWSAVPTSPAERYALVDQLIQQTKGAELRDNLNRMRSCLSRGAATQEFVAEFGLDKGVTGYINHTVPIALYCYLRWPGDFRQAVSDAVLAGAIRIRQPPSSAA